MNDVPAQAVARFVERDIVASFAKGQQRLDACGAASNDCDSFPDVRLRNFAFGKLGFVAQEGVDGAVDDCGNDQAARPIIWSSVRPV